MNRRHSRVVYVVFNHITHHTSKRASKNLSKSLHSIHKQSANHNQTFLLTLASLFSSLFPPDHPEAKREEKIPAREGTTALLRVAMPSVFDLASLCRSRHAPPTLCREVSPRKYTKKMGRRHTLRDDDYSLIFLFF